MKKHFAQTVTVASLVVVVVLAVAFKVFAQSSAQPSGSTAAVSVAQVSAPSVSTSTLPNDPYIQNAAAAQAWLNFLNGRLTWAQSQPDLPSYVVTDAQYAVNQFEQVLLQEGYTQTLGGQITQP